MDKHEALADYVHQLSDNPGTAQLDMDRVPAEDKALAESVCELGRHITELYNLLSDVSAGNGAFDRTLDENNPYYTLCMQSVTILRNLTYVIQQVSQGNYDVEIDFPGSLSASLNEMLSQLKEREQLQTVCEQEKHKVMEERIRTQERELRLQEAHYRQVLQVQDEQRAFRHDIRNHVVSLLALLENGRTEEAISYIRSAFNTALDALPVMTTGCLVLDALVSQKTDLARQQGIHMSLDVRLSGAPKLNADEVSSLIGNALDNAIEAASKSPADSSPFIDFHLSNRSTMLTLLIRNSAVCAPHHNAEGDIITSKRDTKNHGYGMRNMQRVVDRYHGVMNRSWNNGVFSLDILLLNALRPRVRTKPKDKPITLHA